MKLLRIAGFLPPLREVAHPIDVRKGVKPHQLARLAIDAEAVNSSLDPARQRVLLDARAAQESTGPEARGSAGGKKRMKARQKDQEKVDAFIRSKLHWDDRRIARALIEAVRTADVVTLENENDWPKAVGGWVRNHIRPLRKKLMEE